MVDAALATAGERGGLANFERFDHADRGVRKAIRTGILVRVGDDPQQRFVDPEVFLRLPDLLRRGSGTRVELGADRLLVGPNHDVILLFRHLAAGYASLAALPHPRVALLLDQAAHVKTAAAHPRPIPPIPMPPDSPSGASSAPTIFGKVGKWSRM